MVEKIVFHIGDTKTGTSGIQQALLRGLWHCETRSLCYAVTPDAPYHHGLAWQMCRGDPALADSQFAALAARIRAARADVAVVSSELFRDLPPEDLHAAIVRHLPHHAGRVRVLAYTRPHAARFLSFFNQIVKLGHMQEGLETHFERSRTRPLYWHGAVFDRWRAVFGDRFTLRPMVPEALAGGDVLEDFFHQVFDGAAFGLNGRPLANPSHPVGELALLRLFHGVLRRHHAPHARPPHGRALRGARMRVGERLSMHLCDLPGRPSARHRHRIHRDLMARFAETYAPDAARVDAAFFGAPLMQRALEAAFDDVTEAPQSLRARDHYPPEVVRQIQVWGRLVGDLTLLDPERWDGHFLDLLNRSMRGGDG